MDKQVYVVLGMSRTGTSAIARSLIALGINLGDRLIPKGENNPKGFFEDKDVLYQINRGVMASIDKRYMYMDDVSEDNILDNPILSSFRDSAVKLLRSRFQDTHYWGFKDPCTVTIMPFWHSVFEALDVEDKYVIVVRNPLAAAHSNKKFKRCDLEEAMLTWLYRLFAAIDGTQGKHRVVVAYEEMLKDPKLQLQRMHKALAIEGELNEVAVNEYAQKFIDKKLSHYKNDDEDFLQSEITKVAPLTVKLYALLQELSKDQLSFDDPSFQARFAEIKAEFKMRQPVHNYVDSIIARNTELRRELKRIKKSLVWKIISPIYGAHDLIRAIRRRRKQSKRIGLVYD